jgi:hypothetical protein
MKYQHNRVLAVIVSVASVLLTGCITTITSKRVGDKVDGQEYALPLPLIEFIPQADGTLAASVRLVPDPNNRYVVSASSILSTYTLDVQTEDGGLLKKVSLDAKSADIAADVVKQWGDIRKAELTAKATDEKAAKDKAEKTSTDAAKALSDAQLQLDKAQAKLQKLQELAKDPNNKIDPKDIVSAQLDVVQAQVARDAAASGVTKNTAAMDAANGGFPKAWGPVYYRINVTPDSNGKPLAVKLIPSRFPSDPAGAGQVLFDTSELSKPAEPESAVPRLVIKGHRILSFKPSGRYELILEVADGTLKGVEEDKSEILVKKSGDLAGKPILSLQASGTLLLVSFDKPRDRGKYELDVAFVYGNKKRQKLPIDFEIE